jgi:hypothetical protein
MLTKDQFYGSRGEKWAEIEIYWTKDEYLSFEDVPKNNDIFKNIVKYDLKKKKYRKFRRYFTIRFTYNWWNMTIRRKNEKFWNENWFY